MIVEVKDLHKSYKKREVLRGVSFKIEKPGVIGLVGPNGSGKSTLLSCMVGLVDYERGEIEILGKKKGDVQVFRDLSFLKDNRILYPYLTGYDHLKYVCDLQDLPLERIEEVAEKIGITSYLYQKTSSYSLGMKQKLLLALSIINKPKLILMDEPLNGLDPDAIIKTRNLINELGKEGVTIIISSHGLSEMDLITKDILFLHQGKIIGEIGGDYSGKSAEERYREIFYEDA